MGKTILTIDDYKKINDLIRIAESIKILYQKLSDLESKGLKNSSEYIKYIDYLNISVETEDSIINELNLTEEKSLNLIKYILNDRMFITKNIDEVPLSIYRVLCYLLDRIIDDMDKEAIGLVKDENYIFSLLRKNTINNLMCENLYTSLKMEQCFEKDYINNLLYYLNVEIDNTYNKELKKNLIYYKNNLIFKYKSVEHSLKEMNYETNDKIYIDSKYVADYLGINQDNYNLLQSMYGKNISINAINKIFSMDNLKLNNIKGKELLIIYCSILKSSLIFLNDKGFEMIKKYFYDTVSTKNELYKYGIKCIKKIIKDRELNNNNIKKLKLIKYECLY